MGLGNTLAGGSAKNVKGSEAVKGRGQGGQRGPPTRDKGILSSISIFVSIQKFINMGLGLYYKL